MCYCTSVHLSLARSGRALALGLLLGLLLRLGGRLGLGGDGGPLVSGLLGGLGLWLWLLLNLSGSWGRGSLLRLSLGGGGLLALGLGGCSLGRGSDGLGLDRGGRSGLLLLG